MNRREFSVAGLTAMTGAAGLLASISAHAQTPTAGQQYVELPQPVNTSAPAGKVEVIEFFWYACTHCNAFEPLFDAWVKKQPDHVVVHRVPVAFRQDNNFVPLQKLYYTLETMGVLETMHIAAFHAIHNDRQRLNSDESVLAWAESKGLDKAKFKETYNSFSVSNSVRRASQLQDLYRVEGVPSLGVAGKYYTDAPRSGSLAKALETVDFLIAKEHKAS